MIAHVGPCSNGEAATTFGIVTALVFVLFRAWRRKLAARGRVAGLGIPLVVAALVTAGACSGGSGSGGARPLTTARLQIVQPTPAEVTGPDVTLQMTLTGARLVPANVGKPRPDEGHIHVILDGQLVSMVSLTTSYDAHNLTPGSHTFRAEFVATDHLPFKNPVTTAVIFQVRAP